MVIMGLVDLMKLTRKHQPLEVSKKVLVGGVWTF